MIEEKPLQRRRTDTRKISLYSERRLLKPCLEAATSLCGDVIGIICDYASPILVIGSFVTTIDLLSERLCWINKTDICTRRLDDGSPRFRRVVSGELCETPKSQEQKLDLKGFSECFSRLWQLDPLSSFWDVPYPRYTFFAGLNVFLGLNGISSVDVWCIEIF